jgi:hypothetical protein
VQAFFQSQGIPWESIFSREGKFLPKKELYVVEFPAFFAGIVKLSNPKEPFERYESMAAN